MFYTTFKTTDIFILKDNAIYEVFFKTVECAAVNYSTIVFKMLRYMFKIILKFETYSPSWLLKFKHICYTSKITLSISIDELLYVTLKEDFPLNYYSSYASNIERKCYC